MQSVFQIQVPASSSNLGSGFDTISVALSLYLRVTATPKKSPGIVWDPVWEGDNVLERALLDTLGCWGTACPGLRIEMKNEIPLRRGLGSSGAGIIAGIRLAEWIAGSKLSHEELLEFAYPIEGHPDNLAASLLGGFVISRAVDGRVAAERIESPLDCRFVAAVPTLEVATSEARRLLPESYELADVVFNLQRCALLIHAIESGRGHLLREALQDAVHQPYRARLVPGASNILQSHQVPGSLRPQLLGTAISGSGSSLVALATGGYEEIGDWMVQTLKAAGTEAQYLVLEIDREGAR